MIHTVDQATRRRLREHLGRSAYASAERYFGVYAVPAADDRAIVTAAHRTRRRPLHSAAAGTLHAYATPAAR